MGGVRTVRHDQSLGFVEACNAGAALARGALLLFLNNDTFIQSGTLDESAASFVSFSDAGAVGAALVYPDGRLEEAGAIIWNDADALNIGRRQDPDDCDFGFAHAVDYCSAACLMVRRDLYQHLGGFDRRFAPAYYEDTDFCLRLRAAGHRVYVQPSARVVHVEGVSAGTDLNHEIKQFQGVNRGKFHERWKEWLGSAPAPYAFGTSQFRFPGERRILIVDHALPAPDEDGGSVMLMEIVGILRRLGYLVIIGVQDLPHARHDRVRALERCGVQVIRAPHYRSAPRIYFGA